MIDIDLSQVQEKELLRVGTYIFAFRDAPTVQLNSQGDGHTVTCNLVPEGFPDESVKHWFSLKPSQLSDSRPARSIKKFLELFGYPDARVTGEVGQPVRVIAQDGSEVLLKYLRFRASIKHEVAKDRDLTNIRIDTIEGVA